jgi:hypothetical protein
VNMRASVHNFVLVLAMAVIGLLLLKAAARTRLASVPVVGSVLNLASAA